MSDGDKKKTGPKKNSAEELIKQAEERLKARFIGTKHKHEDAVKLYQQAAALYKMEGDWSEAGECLAKAASIRETKIPDDDATELFVEAAQCYVHSDTKEALRMYNIAVKQRMDRNEFSGAARLWKEVAELEEELKNYKGAVASWERAVDCYEADHAKANAAQCLLQMARIWVDRMEFEKAIEIYERVATMQVDSTLSTWKVSDYLWKAGLCQFVLDAKTGQTRTVHEKLVKYAEMDLRFDKTREFVLLQGLVKAFDDEDLPKFTELVFKYDQVTKFDAWTAKMLLAVKNVLKNGVTDAAPSIDIFAGIEKKGASSGASASAGAGGSSAGAGAGAGGKGAAGSSSSKPAKEDEDDGRAAALDELDSLT